MKSQGRIVLNTFPEDWRYYTLTLPVARFAQLSLDQTIKEIIVCNRHFYSVRHIIRRTWGNLWRRRSPLIALIGNLSYRSNLRQDDKAHADFRCQQGSRYTK